MYFTLVNAAKACPGLSGSKDVDRLGQEDLLACELAVRTLVFNYFFCNDTFILFYCQIVNTTGII